ncbi:hypothetical protein IB264_08300 [Ensifer sp. ENS11]|nr:hypothetical protein [Ensifer sp. ENS11]PSS63846.1 hypothetical protein C6558_14220 [Ensifer sp. NM-2]
MRDLIDEIPAHFDMHRVENCRPWCCSWRRSLPRGGPARRCKHRGDRKTHRSRAAASAARLTYRRTNHENFHVRGFIEEGTTTMPFDMTVLNELDRFHLALEAIARVSGLAEKVAGVVVELHGKLDEHHRYVREHGEDIPEIQGWRWPG